MPGFVILILVFVVLAVAIVFISNQEGGWHGGCGGNCGACAGCGGGCAATPVSKTARNR